MPKVIMEHIELITTVEKVKFNSGAETEIEFDLKSVENTKQVTATSPDDSLVLCWEYNSKYIVEVDKTSEIVIKTAAVVEKDADFTIDNSLQGNWVRVKVPNLGSVVTVTIPTESTVFGNRWFKFGEIVFQQVGLGTVHFVTTGGAEIEQFFDTVPLMKKNNAVVGLKHIKENTWLLYGALEDV